MNMNNTAVSVLFMMVSGVGVGGESPEVHDHLHCFERMKLQVVKNLSNVCTNSAIHLSEALFGQD